MSAVTEFMAGRIEYRADNTGNLHAPVGRIDFEAEQLHANVEAFVAHIESIRPAAVKGTFIRSAFLSSTMGPGIRIAV